VLRLEEPPKLPEWSKSFYAVNDPDEWIQPVQDLSE
jgi:hypothetical protein